MKLRLVDINLAIWGTQEFKYNMVPLYMAQMAYVEVAYVLIWIGQPS
jgi:hypothetical protein